MKRIFVVSMLFFVVSIGVAADEFANKFEKYKQDNSVINGNKPSVSSGQNGNISKFGVLYGLNMFSYVGAVDLKSSLMHSIYLFNLKTNGSKTTIAYYGGLETSLVEQDLAHAWTLLDNGDSYSKLSTTALTFGSRYYFANRFIDSDGWFLDASAKLLIFGNKAITLSEMGTSLVLGVGYYFQVMSQASLELMATGAYSQLSSAVHNGTSYKASDSGLDFNYGVQFSYMF